MAKRTKRTTPTTTANGTPTRPSRSNQHITTLKVLLSAAQLDAGLARAERYGLTRLDFAHLLIAEQAQRGRERAIARRIKDAGFRELCTLASTRRSTASRSAQAVRVSCLREYGRLWPGIHVHGLPESGGCIEAWAYGLH
jgi:hypothetical protein